MSEEELVKNCIQKKAIAQRKLYDMFSPKVYPICLRYGNDKNDADEIFQKGFIKVFHSIDRFKFNGPLGAWIRRIIVNTAIDHVKNRKRFRFEAIEDFVEDQTPVDEEGISSLSNDALREALKNLDEEKRLIFNLFCVEDRSHKEIASLLNITEVSCRTKLKRAKQKLRKILTSQLVKKEYNG